MTHTDKEVVFPLTMTWEDGSKQKFQSRAELECDLEDFDSAREPSCKLVDAYGRDVRIKISLTWIECLEFANKMSGE